MDQSGIALPELEEGVKTTIDDPKKNNLGNEEDHILKYVCASLTLSEVKSYVDPLH